jgi:hypothetical protein
VGEGGEEYQVIDIINETTPVRCGGLNIDSGVKGVSAVMESDGDAYSYIVTGDATAELKIIEGGPGSSGTGNYVPSGTFTSQSYGPTSSLATGFNSFLANIYKPSSTEVEIYIAIADAVAGSCAGVNYTFVGPNGGVGPFTTSQTGIASISGVIPFGSYSPSFINPGKCLKYRTVLTTGDSALTPVFKDMVVNYSP